MGEDHRALILTSMLVFVVVLCHDQCCQVCSPVVWMSSPCKRHMNDGVCPLRAFSGGTWWKAVWRRSQSLTTSRGSASIVWVLTLVLPCCSTAPVSGQDLLCCCLHTRYRCSLSSTGQTLLQLLSNTVLTVVRVSKCHTVWTLHVFFFIHKGISFTVGRNQTSHAA